MSLKSALAKSEKITCYDIHTHQQPLHAGDISVISLDLHDQADLSRISSVAEYLSIIQSQGRIHANNQDQYYSVGIHPWNPDKSLMAKVRMYAALPFVIAIGETGLDKISAKTQDEFILQHELFTKHIRLSEETGKPLIIHCVKAWNEILHLHKTTKPLMPWIIHGFRGKKMLADQLLSAGLYLSFGALHNKDAVRSAWEKRRLLAETDDTKTDIHEIYSRIAQNLNIPPEELSEEIEIIFNTLFTKKAN